MIKKISLMLILIFTAFCINAKNTNNEISQQKFNSSKNNTNSAKKPKKLFSLSEDKATQKKVNSSKKDKNFIPTESISEDLSVPFPIDI